MPRRLAAHTQADYARVLRAYRAQGLQVQVVMRPDGSVEFLPFARDGARESADVDIEPKRTVVL